MQKKYRLA